MTTMIARTSTLSIRAWTGLRYERFLTLERNHPAPSYFTNKQSFPFSDSASKILHAILRLTQMHTPSPRNDQLHIFIYNKVNGDSFYSHLVNILVRVEIRFTGQEPRLTGSFILISINRNEHSFERSNTVSLWGEHSR